MGVGLVAGIGFTMSLFIADLAFNSQEIVDAAKVGTFAKLVDLAGAVGFYVLRGASTGATPEKKVAAAKIH